MATPTKVTPQVKVQILQRLGECETPAQVGHWFDLTAYQVIDIAANHGYPDPEKMTLAAGMIAAHLEVAPQEPPGPDPLPQGRVSAAPQQKPAAQWVVSLDYDDDGRTAKPLPYPKGPPRAHPTSPRTLQNIPVDDLHPDPDNPREQLRDIPELSESLEQIGLISPIIARNDNGRLVIVAGHRRHAAAKLLGWATVDVIIRKDMPADDVLVAMVTENTHRVDLDPIEEARAYRRLGLQMGKVSAYMIAARVGRNQVYVSNRLVLLDLPVDEQEALRAGQMNLGDAVRMGRVRSGKVRVTGYTGSPHLGIDHDLSSKARARCRHLAHKNKGRNSVGGVACGACWESVIRANEQERIHAASVKAGRCGICDAPIKPLEAAS